MKKLIIAAVMLCLLLTGCSEKEEYVTYDLAISDVSMTEMCSYLKGYESENFSIMETEISYEEIDIIAKALAASSEGLNSITVYSDKITDEMAQRLIDFVKIKNLPVIFAFSDISPEILESYDKAFCITTDYVHAAEITAVKMKELWTEGVIADNNKDMIFSFTVVTDTNTSDKNTAFHIALTDNIELYGIPKQINDVIDISEVQDAEALAALKAENEGVIIISHSDLQFVNEYTPENENIEIITIQNSTSDIFSENKNVLTCFVDYTLYKTAADEIIKNFNNRQYLLTDISFPYSEKTVYITATI